MNKTTPKPIRLPCCNRMVDKIDARMGFAPDHLLETAASLPAGKLNKIRTGKQHMRAYEIWQISQSLKIPVHYLLDDDLTTIDEQEKASLDIPAVIIPVPATGRNGANKPPVREPKNAPRRKPRKLRDK